MYIDTLRHQVIMHPIYLVPAGNVLLVLPNFMQHYGEWKDKRLRQ